MAHGLSGGSRSPPRRNRAARPHPRETAWSSGASPEASGSATAAREITIQGILARDPELSYAEARAQLLRRLLGPELYDAADLHSVQR